MYTPARHVICSIWLLAALPQAQQPEVEWPVGMVRIEVPALPEVGQTFEVPVRAETGSSLVAALTLKVGWNPGSATLIEVRGGLSVGATHPFVVNDRVPGKVTISDINAPRSSGQGGASYNQAKRGRIELYTLVMRRTGPAPIALSAELDAFHDPGQGAARKPTQIGALAFPRRVEVVGEGAGPVAGLARPVGDTWMEPSAAGASEDTIFVVVRTQLGGSKPERWSLLFRYDPAAYELARVSPGLGGAPPPSTDASLPGMLWVSGGSKVIDQPDARAQATLCTIGLRATASADPERTGDPPLSGKVVSFHREPGPGGEARSLGPLPLPRKIGSRSMGGTWPTPR